MRARYGVMFAIGASLVGCAHAAKQPVATAAAPTESAEMQQLRAQLAEKEQRLNRLESRLALLEASQRELRYALEDQHQALASATAQANRASEKETPRARREEVASEPISAEMRPILRLHEDKRRSGATSFAESEVAPLPSAAPTRAPLMPVPVVDERLPVAPVPSLAAVGKAEPLAPVAPAPDPNDLYKRAIDLVRQREFPQALELLNEFLARYPQHARAPRVMFWRGEVLFAQRDYAHAVEAYESSLAKEPRGEKAADALLKIGLCHKHLGSPERAKAALQRLKTQFPDSDAARLVKEEDAS